MTDRAAPGELLLHAANVLDEGGGFAGPLDVHVRDGRVVAVDRQLAAPDATAVDCTEREIWLTIHPNLRHLARNATVIDWIERTITKLGRMSIPV